MADESQWHASEEGENVNTGSTKQQKWGDKKGRFPFLVLGHSLTQLLGGNWFNFQLLIGGNWFNFQLLIDAPRNNSKRSEFEETLSSNKMIMQNISEGKQKIESEKQIQD